MLLLQCGQPGLAIALCCILLLAGCSGEPSPSATPVLGRNLRQQRRPVENKIALLDKGPGFFRSSGVRSDGEEEAFEELGDAEPNADNTLPTSHFSDSMTSHFLDNLEPIAPMDRLHAALGIDPEPGPGNAMFIPEYLNPEVFPSGKAGKGCNCTMPTAKNKTIQCSCEKSIEYIPRGVFTKQNDYTWLKETPILGTENFTLTPADVTYPGGDYWGPKTNSHLVAPADVLPADAYPNQAFRSFRHSHPQLPASARKDALPVKYSRFLDQIQDRSLECDTISKRCTVPCKPGDDVQATIGNLLVQAKIVKAFVGNAVQVKFTPQLAVGAKETAECPLQVGCTAFRFCKTPDSHCIREIDIKTFNWGGFLHKKYQCPPGSKVCKEVNQVIMATQARKGEKSCRAAVF